MTGATDRVPEVACVPVQASDAVQAVALVDDQVSVAAAPSMRALVEKDRLAVGAGGWVTASVALALVEAPEEFVQVSV